MNFYEFYKLINEYGENLIQTLIEKFQKEDSTLTPTVIRSYIERFERIKNNLENKDISTYSWIDLENAVDGYQSKQRIKAGKLDPNVTDANLLYNKDGIRIYLGKDKKSCIKYGNGYTFCISARGEKNMYGRYRIIKRGTPYFIFNDNLPQSDNRHVIVLFVYKDATTDSWVHRYTVTDALNKGDKNYQNIQNIIKEYPWIKPITNFVGDEDGKGDIDVDPLEEIEYRLEEEFDNKESSIIYHFDMGDEYKRLVIDGLLPDRYLSRRSFYNLFKKSNSQKMKDFLSNNAKIASVFMQFGHTGLTQTLLETSEEADNFFAFYKNTDDILKLIKSAASKALEGDFEYIESDSILKQKISKALKFKFKSLSSIFNHWSGEGAINKYDDFGQRDVAANVKFNLKRKTRYQFPNPDHPRLATNITFSDYFVAKIVDISHVFHTDDNIKRIENLYNSSVKKNKILNWLRVQNKETLEKILIDYSKETVEYRHFLDNTLTDFISNFIESF